MQSIFILYSFLFLGFISNVYSIQNKPPKWDLRRFLKTASFYDALFPKLPFTSRIKQDKLVLKPNDIIWDSKSHKNVKWGPLDDIVMGGVSKSDIEPGDEFNGEWAGYVSTGTFRNIYYIYTYLYYRYFKYFYDS